MPVLLDCNFIVDPTNGDGLGQRSLKGEGISQVYLNSTPAATTATSVFASGQSILTMSSIVNLVVGEVVTDSTTSGNIQSGTTITFVNTTNNQITLSKPTAGASASAPGDTLSFAMTTALVGNPNPEAGIIIVQFSDNYNRYFSGFTGYVGPLSGTPVTSSVASVPNVIVSLGTATLAQWQAVGLPLGITPAVGVSFIATSSAVIGGSASIEVIAASGAGIDHIEVCGDPNTTLHTEGYVNGKRAKGYIILACYKNGVLTAPATGSTISLASYLSNSSNTVKGE
jgi:hypothetical protein